MIGGEEIFMWIFVVLLFFKVLIIFLLVLLCIMELLIIIICLFFKIFLRGLSFMWIFDFFMCGVG